MKYLRLIYLATVAGLSVWSSAAVDRSTPEKTIESFSKCVETKDYDGLLSCIKGGKSNEMMQMMFSPGYPALKLTISVITIDQKPSSATVQAKVTIASEGKEDRGDDTLHIVKEGEIWLLVAETTDPKSKRFASQLIESIAEPDQIFVKAKQNAMATVCKRNINNLGASLLKSAARNGGILRIKKGTWLRDLAPYLPNGTALKCPLDQGGPIGYSANVNLSGKKLSAVKKPSKTVMLFEGQDGQLSFRHGGKASVVFVDGSVKAIDKNEAASLIWKP